MSEYPETRVEDIQQNMANSTEKKLMPNALVVKTATGEELVLPSDKAENAIANKIVAALVRKLLIEKVAEWREANGQMSPKDLKDIAEAAKSIAQFSGEVYKESSDETPRRSAMATEVAAEEVVFEDLGKKPNDDKSA